MCRARRTHAALVGLFLLALAAPVTAGPTWLPVDGATSPQGPTVTVIHSDETETVVRISIPGFWSEDLSVGGNLYQALTIPGHGSTLEVGRPQLPAIAEWIAIPAAADVAVELLEAKEIVFSGYRVHPFQEPTLGNEPKAAFFVDQSQYAKDAFYPASVATLGAPGIWRDLRIMDLRVHPLRCNPVTGEVVACSEILLRISYQGESPRNVKTFPPRPVDPGFDRMYRESVLNYDWLGLTPEEEDDATLSKDGLYEYVIIVADQYWDAMTPFADYKAGLGFSTVRIPASIFGGNPESLKSYLLDLYEIHHNPYVLLVGNENEIPSYDYGQYDSDYWYALLEGDDDYADVAVGRFCVESVEQLQNMISKSMIYESAPPLGEWLEDSVLIAHWEYAPGGAQLCKETVRTAGETVSGTYSVLYPDFVTAYGASVDLGGDEATNADVIAHINAGKRVVNYSGHGDFDCFWDWNVWGESFSVNEVALLDNGQMTPVVFGIACTTNRFTDAATCLGEAFTQGEEGAVAYLGASEKSYADVNRTYDKKLFSAVFDEGLNAIGQASNAAAVRIILVHGQWGVRNARLYLWLGDPSLQVIYQGVIPPPGPELLSNYDGSTTTNCAPTLSWTEVEDRLYFEVQLDNDMDFSSLDRHAPEVYDLSWQVSPSLGLDTWYWRVRALVDGVEPVWSNWSDVGSFTTIASNPSCPVLFIADGNGGFLPENTLLTACQQSGYRDEVTDYYRLPDTVRPIGGQLTLQLRELEDEISYLRDLQLITVHHPLDTQIACSVDGRLILHQTPIPPLYAMDQDDVDRLEEVRGRDGLVFETERSGHLVLKFPYPEDGIFMGPIDPNPKRQCPMTKLAIPEGKTTQLRLEILLPDGRWSEATTAPPREWLHEEVFCRELPPAPADGTVTVRLSWDGPYRTDSMFSLETAEGPVESVTQAVASHELWRASGTSAGWAGWAGPDPLVLERGDILQFGFEPADPVGSKTRTTYILKAVGRYEPIHDSQADLSSGRARLGGNVPNPFNPSTSIHYDLPRTMRVKIEIYDLAGRRIATLVDGMQSAGPKVTIWHGRDSAGHSVASGTYLCRLTADNEVVSRKITLMK